MAVDPVKIRDMMKGRTLEKDNIRKMYTMVENAESPEDKKKVMKHSIFFVGQLPLLSDYRVDLERTRKLLLASVPRPDLDAYMEYLLKGLSIQKLLLEKEDGSWQVNSRYEDPVAKAGRVARAYKADREASFEKEMDQVKKVYQTGTKQYHSGMYDEAAASFKKAVSLGEYRMAYYSLAVMSREGRGLNKDNDRAIYYAANACAKGLLIADELLDELLEVE